MVVLRPSSSPVTTLIISGTGLLEVSGEFGETERGPWGNWEEEEEKNEAGEIKHKNKYFPWYSIRGTGSAGCDSGVWAGARRCRSIGCRAQLLSRTPAFASWHS